MNKLAAAAAALVLGAAAPSLALAQEAAAAPAPSATEASAKAQTYLRELVGWVLPLREVLGGQNEAFLELIEGAELAIDYYDAGEKRDGKAWGRVWAAEQQQAWSDLTAQLERAVEAKPPAPPAEFLADIDSVRMLEAISQMPGAIRGNLTRNRDLAARLAPLVTATAAGDRKAAERLPSEMMNVTIAMVEAENDLAASNLPLTPAGHPTRDLLSSSIAANRAMIAILSAQKLQIDGGEVDEAGLATQIRQHADAVKLAAEDMDAGAENMISDLRRNPAYAGTPFQATLERAIGTYIESAALERELAARLREIAAGVDAPGEVDWEAIQQPIDQIGTLAEKRLEIDARRRQALQGS